VTVLSSPFAVFLIAVVVLWASAWFGATVLKRQRSLAEDERGYFGVIHGATLTLLALIIGFNVAMAINHYDERTNNEEREANAIGTEYLRIGVLADADTMTVRQLLKEYLNDRILFYDTADPKALERVEMDTAQLQVKLWNAVRSPALAQPTPLMALVLSGMNDVLNSQRYTQASYWDRIPPGAWSLMVAIAVFANIMIGYSSRRETQEKAIFFILPVVLSISFMLIADIDSPRGGLIHVRPLNLESLARWLPNFHGTMLEDGSRDFAFKDERTNSPLAVGEQQFLRKNSTHSRPTATSAEIAQQRRHGRLC
jgi:hypothetical protein